MNKYVSPQIQEYMYYMNEYKCIIPFSSGSYVTYFFKENEEIAMSRLHECILITRDDEIIIATHGGEDGTITHYNEILDILTDPLYNKYTKHIHCCFQKQVAEKHPELKEYLFKPDLDLYTGTYGMYVYHFDDGVPIEKFGFFDNYLEYRAIFERKPEKK